MRPINNNKNKLNGEINFIFHWYPNRGLYCILWWQMIIFNFFYEKEERGVSEINILINR